MSQKVLLHLPLLMRRDFASVKSVITTSEVGAASRLTQVTIPMALSWMMSVLVALVTPNAHYRRFSFGENLFNWMRTRRTRIPIDSYPSL